MWEGTAVSDVGRKIVPDKGRLNRERPVTKDLEFPSCTGKSFFIGSGTENTRWSVHREAGWQVWWQDNIKETESKAGYLEKYPFFNWEPVNLFLRSGFTCSCLFLRKTTFAAWFWFFLETVHLISGGVNEQRVAKVQTTENTSAEQWLSSSGDGV